MFVKQVFVFNYNQSQLPFILKMLKKVLITYKIASMLEKWSHIWSWGFLAWKRFHFWFWKFPESLFWEPGLPPLVIEWEESPPDHTRGWFDFLLFTWLRWGGAVASKNSFQTDHFFGGSCVSERFLSFWSRINLKFVETEIGGSAGCCFARNFRSLRSAAAARLYYLEIKKIWASQVNQTLLFRDWFERHEWAGSIRLYYLEI